MTSDTHHPISTARLATLGLAIVWVAAAFWRPESTYHLAPILIVAAAPMMLWKSNGSLLAVTRFGMLVALATTTLLMGLGLLRGPSLLPSGGAFAESLVFGAATALVIVAAAVLPSRKSTH